MSVLILQVAVLFYNVFYYFILAHIIFSWIPSLQQSKIGRVVNFVVGPYLDIFRKIVPPIGMIDLSPIIAIIAYRYIGTFALKGLEEILVFIEKMI